MIERAGQRRFQTERRRTTRCSAASPRVGAPNFLTPAAATRLALRTSASEWVRLASFLTPSDHEELSSTLRMMRSRTLAAAARPRARVCSEKERRLRKTRRKKKKTRDAGEKKRGTRTPSESLSGTSCSPETGFWFLRASDPDASVTESTSLCLLPLWPSSSSATSTKSATSSPKSPTFAKEFIERVVALARRRSVFESGTRVKRSSSIFARASMRANSRFANALDMSPTSPPSSSGASPSSCASSCRIGIGLCFSHGSESSRKVKGRAVSEIDAFVEQRKEKDCPKKKTVQLLIG